METGLFTHFYFCFVVSHITHEARWSIRLVQYVDPDMNVGGWVCFTLCNRIGIQQSGLQQNVMGYDDFDLDVVSLSSGLGRCVVLARPQCFPLCALCNNRGTSAAFPGARGNNSVPLDRHESRAVAGCV